MRNQHAWDSLFAQRDAYDAWLEKNLYLLDSPAILLGDEINTVHFDWAAASADGSLDDRFKVVLVDVNATAYAACSTAVKIFYQEFHENAPNWIVERCFLPASEENQALMTDAGIVPMTAEGHMPVSCFDVICCSQQMIGDEVNLIAMLMSAGIGVTWQQRGERDPIIIRGGASSFNPSIIKDVCDLYYFGEGEGLLLALLRQIEDGLRSGRCKEDILLEAVKTWDCLWAPRFYEERFSDDGKLLGMLPLRDDVPEKIRFRHVPDLDDCFVLTKPVGDSSCKSSIAGGVEITRGCEGQCGFCVSGFTYLPFRARSVDHVMQAIEQHLFHSGVKAITLSSFCGTSYPHLNELMRRICTEIPRGVSVMSQRIDTICSNPEFSALINSLGQDRIVLGVEGISQRLRQAVSKNCSEAQLLQTMRMLCRSGYKMVKLMFIGGLPGESKQDWDELVELTRAIVAIFREEGRAYTAPKLLYSWTPLRVYPFTPLQWTRPVKHASLIPLEARESLEELGVIISEDDLEKNGANDAIVMLLLRGDSRLQPLLLDMARLGICRHNLFDNKAESFICEWINSHDVPGYGYWLRACDHDTVFPWDFIDNGVSKEHLWKRYVESTQDFPRDFPRCLDSCQGCGACSAAERRQMNAYRTTKRLDTQLPLRDLIPQEKGADAGFAPTDDPPTCYAALEFTHDALHRVVINSYWEDELSRALNYAGIRYDRKSVRVFKPFRDRIDWAIGKNVAIVAFWERMDSATLIEAVNAHTVNMVATRVNWFDGKPALLSISYRIPLPPGTDEEEVARRIDAVLASETWIATIAMRSFATDRVVEGEIRDEVYQLALRDHALHMKIVPFLCPYTVFQELLGISWEQAGSCVAERTDYEYVESAGT